jgi:predicted dinucleotide-binding enzyme
LYRFFVHDFIHFIVSVRMTITLIGHGHVGGALAAGWAKVGHTVCLGLRDLSDANALALQQAHPTIRLAPIAEASRGADVVVVAAVPPAVQSIAQHLAPATGQIIIDAMNSVSARPEPFANTFEALRTYLPQARLVKCFNSTGYENMANPRWGNDHAADMFMAGDDLQAKATVRQLALDLGFAECYDFGPADKATLLEHFALAWINLAIFQKQGRNLVFKVLKRD